MVGSTIYKTLLEAGLVEDMTGYYNDYASDISKHYVADDGGIAQSYRTVNGKMYSLPYTGTQPDGGDVLFIREDWLQKLNRRIIMINSGC